MPEAAVDAGYLDQVVQPDELMATAITWPDKWVSRPARLHGNKEAPTGATITHIMDTRNRYGRLRALRSALRPVKLVDRGSQTFSLDRSACRRRLGRN